MFGTLFYVWAALAVILFIGEMFTAGFFMLPFALGATMAAILDLAGLDPIWQLLSFIAVSVIAFLLLRRFADRITRESPVRIGVDRLIGERGVVIEELIPNHPSGQVRIQREEWRADAPGFASVPVGTHVTVEAVQGTHLIVRPELEATTGSPEMGDSQ
jgi:membrane protein implicated in regulation of membrane protease activity